MTPRSKKSRFPSLGPAFLVLGTFIAVALLSMNGFNPTIPRKRDVSIPMTTGGKATVSVTVSRGGSPGMLELSLRTGTGLQFTLPSSWTLSEVRGMGIEGITSEAPTLGGRTWELHAHGTAAFRMDHAPRSFQIRSVTNTPIAIHVRNIFVRENRVEEQEYLVTDRPLQLW